MRPVIFLILLAGLIFPAISKGQTKTDSLEIKKAALNYIEGWYEGDYKRMESALHPELAKRNAVTNNQNRSDLTQMSALTLINYTKAGYGTQIPKEKRQKDVTILDIYKNAASAKIIASDWIDYLHLVKWEGSWKIINVLWEEKPEQK